MKKHNKKMKRRNPRKVFNGRVSFDVELMYDKELTQTEIKKIILDNIGRLLEGPGPKGMPLTIGILRLSANLRKR